MSYTSMFYTTLLAMKNGVTNERWNEACELIDHIEVMSTDLRNTLEELSQLLAEEDGEITDDDGNILDACDVQDMADQVSEIEDLFFNDGHFDED